MIDAANERIRIAQKTVDDENAELFSQLGAINEIRKSKTFTSALVDCTLAMEKAQAILEYYQMALSISSKFVNDMENIGNFAIIENPTDGLEIILQDLKK